MPNSMLIRVHCTATATPSVQPALGGVSRRRSRPNQTEKITTPAKGPSTVKNATIPADRSHDRSALRACTAASALLITSPLAYRPAPIGLSEYPACDPRADG